MNAMATLDTSPIDSPRRTSSVRRLRVAAALRRRRGYLQAGPIKALDFEKTVDFLGNAGWRMPRFAAYLVTGLRDGRRQLAPNGFANTGSSLRRGPSDGPGHRRLLIAAVTAAIATLVC
jgi:hypothetical protein